MPEPLQDRFDVVVDGDIYTFRIPTVKYDIEVGYRAADVRRRIYPEGGGMMNGLDIASVNLSRHFAQLELYLLKATAYWPFGVADGQEPDWTKAPKVDFEKFPADRTDTVYRVGQAFEGEVTRFLSRGNTDQSSAGA